MVEHRVHGYLSRQRGAEAVGYSQFELLHIDDPHLDGPVAPGGRQPSVLRVGSDGEHVSMSAVGADNSRVKTYVGQDLTGAVYEHHPTGIMQPYAEIAASGHPRKTAYILQEGVVPEYSTVDMVEVADDSLGRGRPRPADGVGIAVRFPVDRPRVRLRTSDVTRPVQRHVAGIDAVDHIAVEALRGIVVTSGGGDHGTVGREGTVGGPRGDEQGAGVGRGAGSEVSGVGDHDLTPDVRVIDETAEYDARAVVGDVESPQVAVVLARHVTCPRTGTHQRGRGGTRAFVSHLIGEPVLLAVSGEHPVIGEEDDIDQRVRMPDPEQRAPIADVPHVQTAVVQVYRGEQLSVGAEVEIPQRTIRSRLPHLRGPSTHGRRGICHRPCHRCRPIHRGLIFELRLNRVLCQQHA